MSITRRLRGSPAEGRAVAWMVAGIAALVATAIVASLVTSRRLARTPTVEVPTWRLAWNAPVDLTLGAGPDYPFGLVLAPDGRRLVFPATKEGLGQLWIRDLASGDTQPLAGTDGATLPFWAPDGRAIGFFARGRMLALTLDNGGIADLGAAPVARGGAWHSNGDLIFATDDGGLMRRRGADGAVEPLTELDASTGESSHRLPTLVGRDHVLFYVVAAEPSRQGIWIARLDAPAARSRLATSDGHAVTSGDLVVYASGEGLIARILDIDRQTLTGRDLFLAAPVGVGPQHQLLATVQEDLLLFGRPSAGLRTLRWMDRAGAALGSLGEPMLAWDVRIAPSTTRVAVASVDSQLNTLDIFVYDGERPLPRKLSLAIDADEAPAWSRDGAMVAWTSGRRSLTRRRAAADRPDELVTKLEHPGRVSDWSPDGRWIVVSESRPATRADLWLYTADRGGAPRAYAQSPFNEINGAVSPDGRWIAYASDESGRYEIYVDTFPTPGTRGRLSSGGGLEPRWNADGTELFYRRGREIHVVRPTLGGTPEAAASERLFDAGADVRAYDVTLDGQKFLLNLPADERERPDVSVVVNWRGLLPRRVDREGRSGG